ncbi:MAG: bifunctional hexulose-6-phosphate synthase/ribonuclease regulator [Armatimonadetes bacterium]|nr:bifunctional hexulose-6-phosphate synthase/ribonuclease regulator [Armatimonadota bacterium]
MKPVLQLALDFVNLSQALRAAREATQAGEIWLEAGTPLIKSEGVEAVRKLRAEFPSHTIVADMKIMDAGRVEVEIAAKAGANIVAVLGAASDSTIADCIEAGSHYGAQVMVDLAEVGDPVERAQQVERMGAHLVGVHCPIDVQMVGGTPLETLKAVAAAVSIPVAVAGGINSETAPEAIAAGASVVIVGGAINKAPDAKAATATILRAMETGEAAATTLYKRVGVEGLREVFARCATADIATAMHHEGHLLNIMPVQPGLKVVGTAFTVWTYPGDWHRPVTAIDQAAPGDVLVIDVRGEPPAVWGEQATMSCIQRGLAGVVIHGALRDVEEIRRLKFPAFCTSTCPSAGQPKGVGMIGVPLKIGETHIKPGDWIIGDDDGLVVVPQERAVEIANRALSTVEREDREIAEIQKGSTLAEVGELRRWEQQRGQRTPPEATE